MYIHLIHIYLIVGQKTHSIPKFNCLSLYFIFVDRNYFIHIFLVSISNCHFQILRSGIKQCETLDRSKLCIFTSFTHTYTHTNLFCKNTFRTEKQFFSYIS